MDSSERYLTLLHVSFPEAQIQMVMWNREGFSHVFCFTCSVILPALNLIRWSGDLPRIFRVITRLAMKLL
jgi:hypothetical protein